MKYDAIFFDFGETLEFDSPPIPEGVTKLLRNMGFDVNVDDVYQARDRVHQTGLSTKDYPTPEQMEQYWLVYFQCLLKELAVTNKLEQSAVRLKDEFRYYSGTYLYPEVPYLLSTLKARGHIVGIISNISCMLPAYLEQLGISDYLDFAIASASFGASKPHPSIFEEALRLAMVPAEKAMHVGDSYEADIVGARAVGITPVLIDRDDTSPGADCRRINNLCSLLEL